MDLDIKDVIFKDYKNNENNKFRIITQNFQLEHNFMLDKYKNLKKERLRIDSELKEYENKMNQIFDNILINMQNCEIDYLKTLDEKLLKMSKEACIEEYNQFIKNYQSLYDQYTYDYKKQWMSCYDIYKKYI